MCVHACVCVCVCVRVHTGRGGDGTVCCLQMSDLLVVDV